MPNVTDILNRDLNLLLCEEHTSPREEKQWQRFHEKTLLDPEFDQEEMFA